MGLIALAQGCPDLENLDVTLLDISNEAMEYVGTYLKNLRKFRVNLVNKSCITDLPLDNGIRAMLIGCKKLERLHVSLCHGGLTDVGLGYIGKYGHNLRYLSLEYTGESDAGLVELSKGCPKLRKLRIMECPFSEQAVENFLFNIHTLRYINFLFGDCGLAFTRPMVPADAEVLPELNPYVTLAKKLR
nr:nucleosome assembly protein 1,4 [Tanacetum cinerariifolium]